MRALLDTSALIDPPDLEQQPEEWAISVLSIAELELGARDIRPAALDEGVASEYARLVASKREAGRHPGVIDALIAATARSVRLVLVTRDADQSRIGAIEAMLL